MSRLARPLEDLQEHYDVIVVGSGYGGGVSASRLARAGQNVCVLERGREYLTGEFPTRFPELSRDFQLTGKLIKTGSEPSLYDIRIGEDMHVMVGCGLGGGSLINAGVALRPQSQMFADPAWPEPIVHDGLLDEGFARAERWLRPARHEQAFELAKVKTLAQAAAALGERPVTANVVVNFQAGVNQAGIEQPACTLCGDCCGGCNVGAKNSVALTYLPDAVRHGAELFTHAKTTHITKSDNGTWSVHVQRLPDKAKGAKVAKAAAKDQQLTVTADMVILAAGTLGSNEILLRSREQGLALSNQIGRKFSANGDIIAFGYGAEQLVNAVGVGHPAKVDIEPVGAAVSAQLEFAAPALSADVALEHAEGARRYNAGAGAGVGVVAAEDGMAVHGDTDQKSKSGPLDYETAICVQEGVLPSALAPALPLMFLPKGRLLGAFKSLVAGVYKGPFKHLQTFFAVSHDSASGRFSLVKDRLILSWPNAKAEPVYARIDHMLETMVKAVGGTYMKNPLAGSVMGHQPATAHPLGGCAIGTDASTGVVNHKSQVFDGNAGTASEQVHEGLYVIDGSIIPRSLGVNPLFTITALAERALILMAKDKGWQFNDAALQLGPAQSPTCPGDLTRPREHKEAAKAP